jgi:hypothetical protein
LEDVLARKNESFGSSKKKQRLLTEASHKCEYPSSRSTASQNCICLVQLEIVLGGYSLHSGLGKEDNQHDPSSPKASKSLAALIVITYVFIIVLVVTLHLKIATASAVFVTGNNGAATSRSGTFEERTHLAKDLWALACA